MDQWEHLVPASTGMHRDRRDAGTVGGGDCLGGPGGLPQDGYWPMAGSTVVMAVSSVPQTVMDCHQLLVSVAA